MRKMHLIAMAVLLLIGGGGFWYGLKAKEARALRAELRLQCLEIAEKAEQLCWKDFGSARNDASQALGVWIAKAEAAGLPEVAEVNALRRVVATGAGFAECFRVLKPGGTLVFKWCEAEIPLREVLALTPERPLYGHRSGKKAQTHWCAFLKPNGQEHL